MLKKTIVRLLIVCLLLPVVFMVSCSRSGSGKAMCESNGTYKKYDHKRGQGQYNKKYSYKASPTRKDYVIKNGRKSIVP
jgi:hypothetical protein